ncbi:MAG: hypothetical protein HYX96_01865 [Chloroflexi bacterium]|nr:hypothetical protein [Chloroflexota bacterium]
MEDMMTRVFTLEGLKPHALSPSGVMGKLLVKVENLSLYILESQREVRFSASGHPEEEFVLVLEGKVEYRDGPVVRAGEALFIIPEAYHSGSYSGKLAVIRCLPPVRSKLDPGIMKRVIKPDEMETIRDDTGAAFKLMAATRNMSILRKERQPGSVFTDHTGHPEKEIVYVLQGQVEYDDGRTVRAGEAVVNLSNAPHSGHYGAAGTPRIVEVKSPCEPRFLKMTL